MKKLIVYAIMGLSIFAFSMCNGNQDKNFEKITEFTSAVNQATEDNAISEEEAAEISSLLVEIEKLEENKSFVKDFDSEENVQLKKDMTSALMSLYFCDGMEQIEGLE